MQHLPELTLLEWYTVGHNYFDMMDQCQDLIGFVARRSGFGAQLLYQGQRIDLTTPWDRMSVADAFERFASISMETALLNGCFEEVMTEAIEPKLGNDKPLFLFDYPCAVSALAKLKPNDPSVAERFELYVGGLELCNAFTELGDESEQRLRFEHEQEFRMNAGKQIYPLPEKFLKSLNDMPEASGNALGIDRLVMLFSDTNRIDDVVAFTPEEL